MSKVDELKQWVKDEICRGQFKKFVKVIEDSGEGGGAVGSEYEFRFRFNIYTETHRYRISALDRSSDEGYLGCTASTRKPRAGEDWTRGNDLPDGKFTKETWEHIKNAIIAYELVELAPKIERTIDEAKETVGSIKK
ncbi:hypothetical protein ES703_27687 [subsurface metagenome]